MRRFRWQLQRVLDIKAKEEQKKKAELVAITEKLAQTQGKLLVQEEILREIISDIAKKAPRNRLGQQELFLRYSAVTDELIKQLKKRIQKLKSEQREKIAEVLRARRFKKGLEKLRTEAKMEFIQEEERLDQKQLDEGSTVRFARNIIRRDAISHTVG